MQVLPRYIYFLPSFTLYLLSLLIYIFIYISISVFFFVELFLEFLLVKVRIYSKHYGMKNISQLPNLRLYRDKRGSTWLLRSVVSLLNFHFFKYTHHICCENYQLLSLFFLILLGVLFYLMRFFLTVFIFHLIFYLFILIKLFKVLF